MNSNFSRNLGFVLLGAWFGLVQVRTSAAGDSPMHSLKLEPGLELRYSQLTGDWMDGPDGKPKITRDKDGTPMYDRNEMRVFVTGPGKAKDSVRVILQTVGFVHNPVLTYADVTPSGRIVRYGAPTPAHEDELWRAIFPLLPAGERELQQGYREFDERTTIETKYSVEGDTVHANYAGPLERVATPNEQISMTYRIGTKSRLPEEIRTKGYWKAYKETLERIVKLEEVKHHDARWAREFEAEAMQFFAALDKFNLIRGANAVPLAETERNAGKAAKVLDEMHATLQAAKETIKEPVFRDVLRVMLDNSEKYRPMRLETAKKNAKIAGQISPSWKTTDLDNKVVSIEALRGKIVVLDFWFRQCNYCMRVMPQVEQAAEHFRKAQAPVMFFGATTDKVDADARHVVDQLKLSFPVLHAVEMAKQYDIGVFPTLLVLDQQSKVRGIFTGYSLTLREDVIQCVNDLLKK